jgi:protein-S-isoprenylcysteine O-methyltransferase Ste14
MMALLRSKQHGRGTILLEKGARTNRDVTYRKEKPTVNPSPDGLTGTASWRCREQPRKAYNGAVFEFQKEFPDQFTMKPARELLIRIALLVLIWFLWAWMLNQPLSNIQNLSIIFGGLILAFPVVWVGRKILDQQPTLSRAVWVTTFVHFALGFVFGIPIIRAVATHQDWSGWVLPVPSEIGLALVIITGTAFLLTVANLALKGFGAPFFIALSRKLAADWLHAWTRNPMALAGLAFLLCLGIWFQSVLFVLWVLILIAPALLIFLKVYEERELEIRFGASYLEYKSRTPMLFPRRPRG